jgi:hypothetical protein
MPKAVPFARLASAVLVLAALAGCSSVSHFAEGRDLTPAKTDPKVKDCSKGGAGCPPTDRRQYYDQRTARYYYFDPQAGRYFWENGDPRF